MEKAIGTHPEHKEPIDIYKPSLVVFAGLPLTGKTSLARELAMGSNFRMVDVDEVRQQGVSRDQIRILTPLEEKAAVEATYIRMFELARNYVQTDVPVAMAGVFSRPQPYHEQLKAFIRETQVPLRFFYIPPPDEDEVRRRLAQRLLSPDSKSNITTYESFCEVERRYNLIQGIDIVTIEPNTTVDSRMQCVRASIEDLRMSDD